MKRNTTLLMAGLALAAAAAAATAAQPTKTQRHAAAVAAIQQNPAAKIEAQPRTMAQAEATQVRTKSGGAAVRVPTELWSTLGTRIDAKGDVQLIEYEGDAPTTTEGLPNE